MKQASRQTNTQNRGKGAAGSAGALLKHWLVA